MIYKERYIELYVDDKLVELESQEKLNLRLNSLLYDPTQLNSTQADYSFSFDLPTTVNNNKIFNYANVLSTVNKFIPKYKARVYADGQLLFDGTLIINSVEKDFYNVNLVVIRNIDLDEIFGDTTMNELEWYIPFNGVEDINRYNASANTEVAFPLVSYGPFQKVPTYRDEVGSDFTSKFILDKYNRWYVESFYPSPKMLTTLRKCFENKGYIVDGDVFTDDILSNIYQSVNLSSEQIPNYNLGHPNFGRLSLSLTATTYGSGYEQQLKFPYAKAGAEIGDPLYLEGLTDTVYNWESVRLYDLLSIGNVNVNQSPSYLYQPNEHIIVIPSDGYYKISLEVDNVSQTAQTYTVAQKTLHQIITSGFRERNIQVQQSLLETTPFEIHLVKNYDDDIELIKGQNNKMYINGNPNDTTFISFNNVKEWTTCYPHEDPYNSLLPTEKNSLAFRNTEDVSDTTRGKNITSYSHKRDYSKEILGYVPKSSATNIMGYDPAVNPNFIMGVSTLMYGTPSVIKNGKSWSVTTTSENNVFYEQDGYYRISQNGNTIKREATNYGKNVYYNAPASLFTASKTNASGAVRAMVYLHRNDVLQLYGVQRAYTNTAGTDVNYSTNVRVNLTITAATDRDFNELKAHHYGYTSATEFDYDLRIGNFFNNETTMAEYVRSIANAFNLDITLKDNTISINKKNKFINDTTKIIDIDDRVNSNDAKISYISYPKTMSVRYKTDTDEYGFETTVPQQYINLEDWYNYGDSGFSVIKLSDMDGATDNTLNLPFSYTWYKDFTWYEVDLMDNQTSLTRRLDIPVISKSSYMMDGYDYTESLKHDGYGLPMRFWFKPKITETYVWTDTFPNQLVMVYTPSNVFSDSLFFNLSYKVDEISILTSYFDITPYVSSNYIDVEVYLQPDEYKILKGGGRIHFDNDIYYVVSIEGYDPTSTNLTTLRLLKNTK